jgi:hypothetical protein
VSHRNSLLPAPLKGVDLAVWALLIGACLAAVAVVGRGWTAVDYPVYVMAAYGFLRGEDVYAWGEGDYARAAADLGLGRYALPYRYPPLTALLAVPDRRNSGKKGAAEGLNRVIYLDESGFGLSLPPAYSILDINA